MIDPIDSEEERELKALEEALRREMREPVPLPEGFAGRVLERAYPAASAAKPLRWQAVAAMAAMVMVLGGAGGVWQGRQAKHRAAIQARQQFGLALRITDATLRSAGQRVDNQLARSTARVMPSQTLTEEQ